MLMTSSTATRGRGEEGEGGEGEREGEGQDGIGGRRSGEHRNHRVPIKAAADRSGGGGPPSRSPRLTVMGDLRGERERERE